jgi:DNA-binding MarR family transcriptional regulator
MIPGADDVELNTSFLENNLGFAIRTAQLVIFENLISRFGELDIRPAEFSVLCLIADNPGCRASQIAEYLLIKPSNFVPVISRLEKRRLVKRRLNKADHRRYDLFLTALGERVTCEAREIVIAQEAALNEHVGAMNGDRLLKMLQKVGRINFAGQHMKGSRPWRATPEGRLPSSA